MTPNPYLLIADGRAAEVLPLLEANPSIASMQDEHGYSLVHAAASYNELNLLRKLVHHYHVNVDIRDEDNETPLFSVETVKAARCLVDELGADILAKGTEGKTARESIEADGDYPDVVAYLKSKEEEEEAAAVSGPATGNSEQLASSGSAQLPPVPEGLQVRVGTMDESEAATIEVDPEFRARIEELAARDDFHSPEGQAALRQLVQDAVAGQDFGAERNVRPKTDG